MSGRDWDTMDLIGHEEATVTLSYPRCENNPKAIEIVLSDVRAADDIRVEYDFERDGWKISQKVYAIADDGQLLDESEEWHEQALLPAWQGKVKP